MTCGAWLMLSMPPVSTTSGFAELDHLRAADRRLDAGAAQAVDRQRRHLDRHARLEPDVPRAVDRVGAGLQHVAEDDVVDPLGLARRCARAPRARRSRRARAPRILQLAGVVRHRRARAAENEDRSFMLMRVLSPRQSDMAESRAGDRSRRLRVVPSVAADVRASPVRRRDRGFRPRASIAARFVASSPASRASARPTRSRRSGWRRSSRRTAAPSRAPARTSTSARDGCCPTPPCPARPATSPPRSVMMSPNRLLVTITWNCPGSCTMNIASASM